MREAGKALADVRAWLCDNLDASDAGHVCGMLSVVSRYVMQADELEAKNIKLQDTIKKLKNERERMFKSNVEKNNEILRLLSDNAKLQEQIQEAEYEESRAWDRVRPVELENAELHKLVEDMLSYIEIQIAFKRRPKKKMYKQFANRAQELRIEVD